MNHLLTKEPRGENQYGQAHTRRRIRWSAVLPIATLLILCSLVCFHYATAPQVRAWAVFSILATVNSVASLWWTSLIGRSLSHEQDSVVGAVGACILIGWLVLLFFFLALIGVFG